MDHFSFESRAALPPVAPAARKHPTPLTLDGPTMRDFPSRVREPVSWILKDSALSVVAFACRLEQEYRNSRSEVFEARRRKASTVWYKNDTAHRGIDCIVSIASAD